MTEDQLREIVDEAVGNILAMLATMTPSDPTDRTDEILV